MSSVAEVLRGLGYSRYTASEEQVAAALALLLSPGRASSELELTATDQRYLRQHARFAAASSEQLADRTRASPIPARWMTSPERSYSAHRLR